MRAEGLANQASQAIAPDRVAGRADADGHPEPGLARFIVHALHDEQSIAQTLSYPSHTLEVCGAVEFLAGPQPVTPGRKVTLQRRSVTARRLRPFARRRFRIWRPFFVAMRARKPCVRLRLILLGWYVRFVAMIPNL